MRRMLVLPALTACGALLVSGCGGSDDPPATAATDGASSAAPSSPAPSSPAPSSPAVSSPAAASPEGASGSAPTLGPDGYGALKLGMGKAEAEAAVRLAISPDGPPAGGACGLYRMVAADTRVYISKQLGVSTIFAASGMVTPQGIRVGSSATDVKRAYPDLEVGINGSSADVPGNPQAWYGFQVANGEVETMQLSLQGQDCHS